MRWLTSSAAFLRGRSPAELALAFALSTFQVSLLVLLGAFLVFRGGSIDGLDTASGVLLFLWLWLTSSYWTLVAVSNVGLASLAGDPFPEMLAEGVKRGAMTGVVFFVGLMLSVVLVVGLGLSDGVEDGAAEAASLLLFVLVYLVVGSVVAGIIGGALGFVFAVVERLLLQLAKLAVGQRSG